MKTSRIVVAVLSLLAGSAAADPTGVWVLSQDRTQTAAVKAPSTAPLATDPALVVAISPNSTITTSSGLLADRISIGTITAVSTGVAISAQGIGDVGVTITGVWSATLAFQGTIDGTNWFALQALPLPLTGASVTIATTAANGQWTVPSSGLAQVRVFATAYTSGTATVTLEGNQASSLTTGITTVQGTVTTSDLADGSLTGGAAGSKSIAAGGVFNTSLPTLTNGQQAAVQLDSLGRQLVVVANAPIPVTAASLPLPTGAATSAIQTNGTQETEINNGGTVAAVKAASTAAVATDPALVVAVSPNNTVAVTGTVTANAGTGTFAISAASLPLPTGAATSANQTNGTQQVEINNGATVAAVKAASTAAVAADPALVVAISPNNTIAASATFPDTATTTQTLGALNAACTLTLAGSSGASWQVAAGTLVGTVINEVSYDNGTTWINENFTDPTTVGLAKSLNVVFGASNTAFTRTLVNPDGARLARLRVSAYTSGTANCLAQATAGAITDTPATSAPGTTAPAAVTVQGSASGVAVPVSSTQLPAALDGSGFLKTHEQGTATVTGTVTANAGTGTFAISAASLPLPTGAATSAIQTNGTQETEINNGGTVAAVKAASTAAVATDPALVVAVSPNNTVAVSLAANQSVNLAQVGGTNVLTGGVAGSQGVGGLAATGAVPSGNPVLVGGFDGTDVRDLSTDASGHLVVAGTGTFTVSGTVTANAGTGTFAISAASLPLPTGAATSANQTNGTQQVEINNGATVAAVKAASTAAVAADPALVVAISPNNTIAASATFPDTATTTQTLGALNAACTLTLAGSSGASWQVAAGTLVGTVINEVSYDNGTTWINENFTDPTTVGLAKSLNVVFGASNTAFTRTLVNPDGARLARLRVSAYTSGTANCLAQATAGAITDTPATSAPGTTAPAAVTVQGSASGVAVPVSSTQLPAALDGSGFLKTHEQGTATVTGTVTANAGTGTFAISAASLPLPTGAATSAIQTNGTQETEINNGGTVAAVKAASTAAVATDPALVVAVSPNNTVAVSLAANQSVNLAQVGGTNVLTGGVAGSQGVGGLAATGAVPSGNPVLVGGFDGTDVRDLSTDASGHLVVAGTGTFTVSGTVTANAGTGTFAISAASLPLPTGAAQDSTLTGGTQKTEINNGATVAAVKAASTAAVAADPALVVAVSPNNTIPENVTQFGGVALSTGTGAGGTGIPRVTVSNDSNILSSQSGAWSVTSLASNNAIGSVYFAGSGAIPLNAVTTTGASAAQQIGSIGYAGMVAATSWTTTGAPTTVNLIIQCSSDGSHWFTVSSVGTGASGYLAANVQLFTSCRLNLTAFSGGSSPTLTAYLVFLMAPPAGDVVSYSTAAAATNNAQVVALHPSSPLPAGSNALGSVTVTGTPAVSAQESGTWTVQPGNTANTTPWLVTDSSDFTVSSSVGTNPGKAGLIAGLFNTSTPAPTNGQATALQVDSQGDLKVNVVQSVLSGSPFKALNAVTTAATCSSAVTNPGFNSINLSWTTTGSPTNVVLELEGSADNSTYFECGGLTPSTFTSGLTTFNCSLPFLKACTVTFSGGSSPTVTAYLSGSAAPATGDLINNQTGSGPITSGNVAQAVALSPLSAAVATQGSTAPTNNLLTGAVYNSTTQTTTTGNVLNLQADVNGLLRVNQGGWARYHAAAISLGGNTAGTNTIICGIWNPATSTVAVRVEKILFDTVTNGVPASSGSTDLKIVRITALTPGNCTAVTGVKSDADSPALGATVYNTCSPQPTFQSIYAYWDNQAYTTTAPTWGSHVPPGNILWNDIDTGGIPLTARAGIGEGWAVVTNNSSTFSSADHFACTFVWTEH